MRIGLVYGGYAVAVAALSGLVAWKTGASPYLEFGHDIDLRPVQYAIALALFTIITIVFVMAARARPSPLAELAERIARRPVPWLLGCTAFTLIAAVFVARFVLDAFPNSGDEYTNLVQSADYLHGRLWADAPPLPAFFQRFQLRIVDGKWVGIYPPGWPAILALGQSFGLPAYLIDPLIAAATTVTFFVLARREVSVGTAALAVGSLVLSAFFLFTEASFFSHGAITLAGLLAVLAGRRFLERPIASSGVCAGLSLGFIVLTRPDAAVLLGLPLAVQIAATLSWQRYLSAAWIALGALPGAVLLLAYFHAVTGNALLPVPNWSVPGQERLVLPAIASAEDVTLKLLIWRLWLLMIWTSPLLVIGAPIAFVQCLRQRKLDFADFYPVITVAFFVFYPGTGGNQYGPRYYFIALPFMILTVAKAVDPLLADPTSGWRRLCLHLVAAHLIAQAVILPFRAAREHQVVVQRQDLYRQVEQAGLSNALVLVASSTAPLRPMFPADLIRNGATLDRPVIYALDLRGGTGELREAFPDRRFYRYERMSGQAVGSLRALADPAKAGL